MKFTILQKRRICLILAMIMVLSGVCLEQKTHSSFEWKNTQHTSSYTFANSFSLTNQDWCPNELIGLRNNRNTNRLVQGRLKSEKSEFSKRVLAYSYLAILSEITHFFISKKDELYVSATSSHFAVIQYIHHQDGAKG